MYTISYLLTDAFGRIIAGNHDLTLHKGWYDDNYDRFHGRGGKQVRFPIYDAFSFDIDSFHQNYEPIHSLLTGPRSLQSNLVYLENQVYKFQVKSGGREWTVYGSPVCYQLFRVFPLC